MSMCEVFFCIVARRCLLWSVHSIGIILFVFAQLHSALQGQICLLLQCRWHHPYGRKWRTIQPPDESERGEWKIWLKAQHSENEDHDIWSHYFMTNRWRNSGNSGRLYFVGLQNHCRWWVQPWNWQMLAPGKKSYDQPRQHIKKQRHYFTNKSLSSQGYVFSSMDGYWKMYGWMWE